MRYVINFPHELDYNIYVYGNLDIYDNELVNRLNKFGVTNKILTEWNNIKPFEPVNYSLREKIRSLYSRLVRSAIQDITKRT